MRNLHKHLTVIFQVLVSLLMVKCLVTEDVKVIPCRPLAFSFPCANNPKWFIQSTLVQEGNINWDGVFYLDQFRYESSVRIQLLTDQPASITLRNTFGSIITSDNKTFFISTFKLPPEIYRVEMQVKGLIQGFFPHLLSLRFNDRPLCDNSFRDMSAPYQKKSISCGNVQIGRHQGLISNSYDAAPGAWPWHVAIYHKRSNKLPKYQCGGSLVSSDMILTTAHCLFGRDGGVVPKSDIIVYLGKHSLSSNDEHTKEVEVKQVIVHQSFLKRTYSNDIGLLKLKDHVQFTKYIQPICLWNELPQHHVYFQTGYVVGWGLTEQGNEPAEILREVQMPVIDSMQCLDSNRDVFGQFLSPTNFCAGYRNGTSVCSGDSGSGMFINVNGVWMLRGLVSLGVKSLHETECNPTDYVLLTDVLRYIDWIKEKMGK